MRNYEMMLIARPDLDDAGNQALLDRVSTLVNANGGAIEKMEPSKKQRLAYEINDLREGIYTVVYFKGEPRTAEELTRVLKITDEVVRFMIVRPEE
ncbi:MAG: ribosomal protein [Symbiobacteriaceae bacterium]|jgi:small subunit ribosomal protein S6|nr:ribosomal protein [Symbiobacteriaceae bacterium]